MPSGKSKDKDNQSLAAQDASLVKKSANQRQTRSSKEDTLDANEQELAEANGATSPAAASLVSNPMATNMDILVEIRELAKKMTTMEGTMRNRLDDIDGSLSDIKNSVVSVESSISTLSERATNLETRVDETESRISAVEDQTNEHDSKLKSLEKTMELLRQKVDNLESDQRRRNLKIINFPDKVEKDTPLPRFLQSLLPSLVHLPADYPTLDIEYARRRDGPNYVNSTAKTVFVRFSHTSQRDMVIKAAMSQKLILYEGFTLRFYPDVPVDILRRRREFDSVRKTLITHNMYRGFAYPCRLRCLYEGKIHLFDTPKSVVEFLQSIQLETSTG